MNEDVLVDTSIIIDFLRQKDKEKCCFLDLSRKVNVCLDFTIISELWIGKSMKKAKTRQRVEKLIENCKILTPNIEMAKKAGNIIRNYNMGFQDAWIAAVAIILKIRLATFNRKDFSKINGLNLYKLGG